MPGTRRIGAYALASVLVLACFVLANVEAFAGHTDDGCAVEVHCFACYWLLTGRAEAASPGCLAPAAAPPTCCCVSGGTRSLESPAPDRTSRGPPETA